MEVSNGIYALPQTLELGDQKEEIYPVAVEDQNGLILIDAGLPGNLEEIESNLKKHGFELEDVEKLVLTHQDFDHCGCASKLVDKTGVPVYAHRKDAKAIDEREDPIKGDERYSPMHVDVELTGGETIRTQNQYIQIIHTPGHTSGHISLLTDNLLISGDVLNVEEAGFSGPRERFTPDMGESIQSLNKLSFKEFNKVHCFHGGTVERDSKDVKQIFENLNEEHPGYQKTSVEGPDRFLRSELEKEEVGLSIFQTPEGDTHGSQNKPEKGHRHATKTESYYFQHGSGTFNIGGEELEYSQGDAFIVKPYKLSRVTVKKHKEVITAGAPVGDKAEEGKL